MNNIKYSSTNSDGTNETAVRVYIDGVMVVELKPNKRNPLAYLQSLTRSKYFVELVDQLNYAMGSGIATYEQASEIKSHIMQSV